LSEVLQISKLTKSFTGNAQPAVQKVSFSLKKGDIATIVGSSGSGKTTLLRMIAGLEIPETGQIIIDGKVINDKNIFIPPEKRNCSLVFQSYALFPHLNVRDNIYFGKNSSQNYDLIQNLIEITKIDQIQDRFPHQISGGQQQRVALVRALSINPSVLLMDEPLSNLDRELRLNVRTEIVSLLKKLKITTLIVSHDTEDALAVSDKIIVLEKGMISQIGSPLEVFNTPKNCHVALLFGQSNFIPIDNLKKKHKYFILNEKNEKVISVRPSQLKIVNESALDDDFFFEGSIINICLLGLHKQLTIKCKQFVVNVNLSNLEEAIIGDKVKVVFKKTYFQI
jgi:iron(III) transport system ATP-binding protein